eukprot:12913848-Prorocentrum_lima.AAC.1
MEEQSSGRQAHMRQQLCCWNNNKSIRWMPHRDSGTSVKCRKVAECNETWKISCWQSRATRQEQGLRQSVAV